MDVQVITVADYEGDLIIYIIPAELADEVVDLDDLDDDRRLTQPRPEFNKDEVIMETLHSIAEFTEWVRENKNIEVTSYWETHI